jgi:hypothetical protein
MSPLIYLDVNMDVSKDDANLMIENCRLAANHADFPPYVELKITCGPHDSTKYYHISVRAKDERLRAIGKYHSVHVGLDRKTDKHTPGDFVYYPGPELPANHKRKRPRG